MNIELLINNIGYVVSIIVCLSLGILVYVRRPKDKGALTNKMFLVASICVVIWQASFVIGINTRDPYLSRDAFMFNLVTLFLTITTGHLILSLTGRLQKQKKVLTILYVIGTILCIFYTIFPDSFLLPSQPKLYLPNFFVPGPFYEVQDTFFFIVVMYDFLQIFIAYFKADHRIRNKLKYFMVALAFGYAVSISAEFLLYGVSIDPILAALTGLYTIPMAYAIIKYDTIDLNFLAKRAFGYALAIGSFTLIILLIGYLNDFIGGILPGFPQWIIPLISGMIALAVGLFVWRRMKELDVLKYEFVTVVTHKFRTPLTHIRWSAENLRTIDKPEEKELAITNIDEATKKLYDLTDVLAGIAGSDDSQYLYQVTNEHVADILRVTVPGAMDRFRDKSIHMEQHIDENLPLVHVDRKKTEFAIQMILENAILYSPDKNRIIISAKARKSFVVISVQDFGIGISKEDMPRLFSKFFRSHEATTAHTEGLGIGLFLSRDILNRQGGDVWAESAGRGKGSTFFIKLPTH